MRAHLVCKFEELEAAFYKCRQKGTNEQISVHGITNDKVRWRQEGGNIL
jgi:hypothetical protein